MKRSFTARRAREDRAGVDGAEQLDAHVDLGGVAQAARAQLDVLEHFAIGVKGRVVVDAARHVRPMAGLDLVVSDLFEIEDIQGVGRATNKVGRFRGLLGGRALLEEAGQSAERGDIGAGGQKLEKFAPGRGGGMVLHSLRIVAPQSLYNRRSCRVPGF